MEEWIKKSDVVKAFEDVLDCDFYHVSEETPRERIKAIPSADRPNGEWIPCSERMPEPGSWAIWCSIKGIIQVARWKEDAIDHFFPDQGFFNLEDAVAWMPLPEPWKGADDGRHDI